MAHEAFLQAILAEPDEEAHRLVYADWLTERGDPRGEFIHVQCLLHRWREGTGDWIAVAPRLGELRRREKQLLAEHGKQWAAFTGKLPTQPVFRRGFVEEIYLGDPTAHVRLAEIGRQTPVRRLRLGSAFDADRVGALPLLARLEGLTLPSTGLPLLRSPHLTGLRSLALTNLYAIGRREYESLANWTGLSRLQWLSPGRLIGAPGASRGILGSRHLPRGCVVWLNPRRWGQVTAPVLRGLTLPEWATVQPSDPAPVLSFVWSLLAGWHPHPWKFANRGLGREAFAEPERAVEVLRGALQHPDRLRREAAALLLGRFGEDALPALPDLVRLVHGNDYLAARAALALRDLLPFVPATLQLWLWVFAHPYFTAQECLERSRHTLSLSSAQRKAVPDAVAPQRCAELIAWALQANSGG